MPIINLDENVLKSLEFFIKNKPPKLNLNQFKFPFVVGSGNAYNTGQILFSSRNAIITDESNFKMKIKAYVPMIKKGVIKEAIIISASGEKDSVWEVELAKKNKLKTTLLTNSPDSSAAKISDKVISYRKIAEPYSYNFSTYLAMILSATEEDPKQIVNYLKKLKLPRNFKNYKAYAFVLADDYAGVRATLWQKDGELFGPYFSFRSYTEGQARHANFINPWEQELVIGIGIKNKYFGHPKGRWDIDLPKNAGQAFVFSLAYYLSGKIQESKPPYFKNNIEAYCNDYGPRAYGRTKPFDVIVPGN